MKIFTPKNIIFISLLYLIMVTIIFKFLGFYEQSTFFSFNYKITFFNAKIDKYETYVAIHTIIFIHQTFLNLINTIVYPWIINEVQNKNCRTLSYKPITTVIIVNAFDIYSQLDMVLILMGFTTQISFVINIIISNLITNTITTCNYVKNKRVDSSQYLLEQIL
jgi:hypothetical protein